MAKKMKDELNIGTIDENTGLMYIDEVNAYNRRLSSIMMLYLKYTTDEEEKLNAIEAIAAELGISVEAVKFQVETFYNDYVAFNKKVTEAPAVPVKKISNF